MTSLAPSLLPLREDLRLHETAPERDGSPAWSIQDPVTNRFFRIGWLEFECLLRWPGEPQAIVDDIAASTSLLVDIEQVNDFAGFLKSNQLLRPTPAAVEQMADDLPRAGWRNWRWWLHNYLFIRIPLVRPDRFLAAALPLIQPLFGPIGRVMLLVASLLGIILVARQWDVFSHSVIESMSPAGLTGLVLAIIISKSCHELGHALVATRYGVRVSQMGIALVVLWPMLYTDTSESWKLRSSRQRLAVSAAGILVEMALAGLATLAWALLDDGPWRQAMLYLATTGWLLSLALNASPFMRFDGYFILADLIDLPNLHERSGALARAWLRRVILGIADPDPEQFSSNWRRGLIVFALVTWCYRLAVFLGIAIAVYLFFFKLLGLFLFSLEVVWFILRPVWGELRVWQARWSEVGWSRRFWLGNLGLGILVLAFIPWSLPISAPGVAHPARQQTVFSPFPSQISQLAPTGLVSKGAALAMFTSPDLTARRQRTDAIVEALRLRLAAIAVESGSVDQRLATAERLEEQLAEAHAYQEEEDRLRVIAEFSGIWLDIDPALHSSTWVNGKNQIGVLVDPAKWIVDVYLEQRQVGRIKVGGQARFRPERQWTSINARVVSVDSTPITRLSLAMLDSRHGGPIRTHPGQQQAMPVEALYRVRLVLAQPLAGLHETRGQAIMVGSRVSLAWEFLKGAAVVFVREIGF